jgi:hypothetical protein
MKWIWDGFFIMNVSQVYSLCVYVARILNFSYKRIILLSDVEFVTEVWFMIPLFCFTTLLYVPAALSPDKILRCVSNRMLLGWLEMMSQRK